tara:strand:- start:538 stop:786 length:249 start_codon:yes stop_codon:yes gene_type:complete
MSKEKILLSSDQYIELTCDIADWIMQERYGDDYEKYTIEEDEVISFTEKGQDIFNSLVEEVEILLEDRADIVNEMNERKDNE